MMFFCKGKHQPFSRMYKICILLYDKYTRKKVNTKKYAAETVPANNLFTYIMLAQNNQIMSQ